MFDFFKDTFLELQGYDVEKIKADKKEKLEKTGILAANTKAIIWIMGILYLAVGITQIITLSNAGFNPLIIKYILLIIVDISCLILITFRSKKMQQIGIGFILLFIILNFCFH